MENGVGVAAEGLKTEEPEEVVVGGVQDEADEVFEEAVELVEDGGDGFKRDSVDDALFTDANDDSGSNFSAVEVSSGFGDREEIAEEAVEGFSEAVGEPQSVENKDGDDSVGVVDQREDDGEAGIRVDNVVDQESEPAVGDEDVVEKPVIAETRDNRDVEKMEGDSLGVEDARVSEHKDSEDQLEKHVEETSASTNLEIQDGHGKPEDNQTTSPPVHRFGDSWDEEPYSGPSASVHNVKPEGNQTTSPPVHRFGDSWDEEPYSDTSASVDNLKAEDNQTTSPPEHRFGDSWDEELYSDTSASVDNLKAEGNQTTSPPEHRFGDSWDEEPSSGASASADSVANASEKEQSASLPASSVEKDVKNVTVTSDSGTRSVTSDSVPSDRETKNDTFNPLKSSGTVVVDRQASTERPAVEVGKREESTQASKETTKPAQPTVRSFEKSANPAVPPTRPAGLGSAASLLEPAPRAANQPRANGQQSQTQSNAAEDTNDGEAEEGDEVRQKLQMIRVKFLRLAHRLGQTPHNVVVAQVLYRLGLAEQLRARNGGRFGAFSFDRASAMAEQLEASGQEPLDFSCTIMVLGKTGVGKSATINSIFDEVKFNTDAFQMGTKKVQDVIGTVQGIKVRVIDTPGLLSSCADQRQNEKILNSVKRFIKKSPPDIVLYLDRLDMPSRDFADMPLLRTITEIFGPSIWFNAIVVLTHAASAPPEGPNGTASTYDMFVTQRSHAVQQAIRQAAGDMRLMNPVSLVENHSACRTNRAGQRVLPNGQVWKPHLLLLSFASKILAEANTLLKLQDTPPGKTFTPRSRAPPLPFLLSSLLQSKPQLKLPEEQFGDDDAIDDELDDSSGSEDESEYDELPPFKPLTKAQLAKLSKAQKKAYYDEIEYREKLLMKKQMKEEKRRRKLMKQMAAAAKDMVGEYTENVEEESGETSSVPVPMPDLSLPALFDSDNPTHRYRHLDTSNQWLVRPVLDNHGWDHDVGYEGINVERMFAVKNKIPVSFSGQISKDKKEANLQMEVCSSIKHGEGKATTLGLDMQSVGKDMAYTVRSESRFSNYRHNKATAGLSATLLGDSVSVGVKLEDKLIVNKQFKVVVSGGAMASRGDVAYGGSLEATLRDKDFPLGRFLSTLGLSIMDWHGELALGCNLQTQIPVGRSNNLIARANLNNRGSGQVSLRLNSSEQVQLALIGLIPLIRRLVGEYQGHSFGQ